MSCPFFVLWFHFENEMDVVYEIMLTVCKVIFFVYDLILEMVLTQYREAKNVHKSYVGCDGHVFP